MNKRIIKLRVYWFWQTSKELKWLEQMAAQGLQLVSAIPFFYFFKQAEPEDVHYCHDYVRVKASERENYLQIFEDAGWQYVMRYGNWFYFKSKSEEKVYSDNYSDSLRSLSIIKNIFNVYAMALVASVASFAIGYAFDADLLLGFASGLGSVSAVLCLLNTMERVCSSR